jgi:hypothetical protein
MTALQDWLNRGLLNSGQMNPLNITEIFRNALSPRRDEEEAEREPEPILMGRGLERC